MQFNEAVAYIENIPKFASKNTLETTAYFLARLGDPQKAFKVIHVAGTNGKGSTCAYLNQMIDSLGIKVGMFTSPHLIEMTERIQMNGVNISKKEFVEIFLEVKSQAIALENEIPHPSFFEFIMIMSFIAFKRHEMEYVILETGLGGRYDNTNVVKEKEAVIITSIGIDHEQYLGTTIEEIAYQKAGIIRKGTPVFYDDSDTKVAQVIQEYSKKLNASCRKISDYAYEIHESSGKYIAFSMEGAYDKDTPWMIPNKGIYQVKNAILAIATIAELFPDVDMKQLQTAMKSVYWPGRMEEVTPGVFIDGAHNVPAILALVQEVKELDYLVYAAVEDKNYKEIIKVISKHIKINKIIVTKVENSRAVDPKHLEKEFLKHGQAKITHTSCVEEAMKILEGKETTQRALCMGSLYFVGEIKKCLKDKKEY